MEWPILEKVEVEWMDSCTNKGWNDLKNHIREGTPATCRTIGYLLVNDKKKVVLMQSQSAASSHVADAMIIPKAVVKSIKKLTGGL